MKTIYNKFNRGVVDPRALGRDDIERIQHSAATMENWLPQRLGPMATRPGTALVRDGVAGSYTVPFIAATDDTAELEFSENQLRIIINDTPLTRVSVSTSVTNGDFATDISGWTDDSDAAGNAAWDSSGAAALWGTDYDSGALTQTVLVALADRDVEHGIRVVVREAPVRLRITELTAELVDVYLDPGEHSLAYVPTRPEFDITISNAKRYKALVESIQIEAAGVVSFTTDITEPSQVRTDQSVDVMFVACGNEVAPKQISRQGTRSWSITAFRADDGPFLPLDTSNAMLTFDFVTAAPFVAVLNTTTAVEELEGANFTLSSNVALFKPGHEGALIKLFDATYDCAVQRITGDNQAGPSVNLNGNNYTTVNGATVNQRVYDVYIDNLTSALVALASSVKDAESFQITEAYSTNQSFLESDGLNGATLDYRLQTPLDGVYSQVDDGIRTMIFCNGSSECVVRILEYISATQVRVQVVQGQAFVAGYSDFQFGAWSLENGYPTAVSLEDGRLWWASNNRIDGSVSDDFTSYDTSLEGDSSAISRTIGFGPADDIHWLRASVRLALGLTSDEICVTSTNRGETLTPTNTALRPGSTQGVADIDALEVDGTIYFVQRAKNRMMQLVYDGGTNSFASIDQNTLTPTLLWAGIKRLAVSRQPETRVYALMDNGTIYVYTVDSSEEVAGWSLVKFDGANVEDIWVLPSSTGEDPVYITIERMGTRYVERFAPVYDSADYYLDSYVEYTLPGTTLTGLDHLDGETVGVFADGVDRGDFDVIGGEVTLGASYTSVVAGLRFSATYVSNKLGMYLRASAIGNRKRVHHIGLMMLDAMLNRIETGNEVGNTYDMPRIEDGTTVTDNVVSTVYDERPFEFEGSYDVDSRVVIVANGPATILALTIEVDDSDYSPPAAA